MSGKDRDQDAPSLEPPSLFGRKRRRKDAAAEAPPAPSPVAADEASTTTVEQVDTPVPTPARQAQPVRARAPRAEATDHRPAAPPPPLAADVGARGPEPVAAVQPRAPREPLVTGMAAACLTGVVVGLGTVASTWAGLRVCEAAKGTSSCGTPGFLLLLAILVAMVLVGSTLLRAFRVPDPGSTSFLAVGLLTVIVLLFLVEVLFSWAMVVVVPLFAVGCFALSYWVTTTFVEPAD